MRCVECKAEIKFDTMFCPKCSALVTKIEQTKPVIVKTRNKANKSFKVKESKEFKISPKTEKIIASIMLKIIMIIIVVYAIRMLLPFAMS